jgi:5-methylcytosine-specific restriction endonuclease McrA
LTKRHQKKFCSMSCQRALQRRTLVAHWLATGEGAPQARDDHYIRAHVLAEQQGRCLICGASAEWNGLPLAFVMDHVDGDSTNNRRENLRLVCPNCDSQLPTFKSRNKGKGRHWRRERYANGQSY